MSVPHHDCHGPGTWSSDNPPVPDSCKKGRHEFKLTMCDWCVYHCEHCEATLTSWDIPPPPPLHLKPSLMAILTGPYDWVRSLLKRW